MSSEARGALIAAWLLATVAWLVNDQTFALILFGLFLPLVVFAMTRMPLRHSLFGLMLGALTLPNPNEGFPWGEWNAPYWRFGWLLLAHINTYDRGNPLISWCPLSGFDVLLLALGAIVLARRPWRRNRVKNAATAPMNKLARISLVATLFVWLWGMLRGGDFNMSLWQLNSVVYLPCVYLLFQASLRGSRDNTTLLKILVAAALYRALLATFVIHNFPGPPGWDGLPTKLAYATSHADSMLFADAFVGLAALFSERKLKGRKWRYLLLLPLLLLGMVSNNRRLVWVHLGMALGVLYLITVDNPLKRRVRQVAFALAPVVVLYFVIGWNKLYGSFFKPVRILRSVIDAESDSSGSSYWREIENYNLVQTLMSHPIFGKGYGHGFDEIVPLPAIDYALELYCPHNSILGLWAYCGYLGYAGTTMLWVAGVYFAMRAYRRTTEPSERVAALTCITALLVYVMHCWGDLGLGTWTGVFTAATALAVASKLGADGANVGPPTPKPPLVHVTARRAPGPPTTSITREP